MTLTASDKKVLAKAADIVQNGWCKGVMAVDADGNPVEPWDRGADKFCALGAIELSILGKKKSHKMSDRQQAQWDRIVNMIVATNGCQTVPDWNDKPSRRKGDVVKLFRKLAAS